MNDDTLRRAHRDAMPDPPSRDDCPSPDELDRLARRDGPEAELVRGLDHVMGCRRCLPEFELLRSVHAAGRSETPAPRRLPGVVWAVAALAVLAVGVVTLMPRLRSGPGADPVRGGAGGVTLIAPAEARDAGIPVRLVWRPVPDLDRFDVEVLDVGDSVVAATATADTSWTVAAELAEGASYRWRVTAVTLSGQVLRSEIRSFRVRTR
jgi:hypothetical protein